MTKAAKSRMSRVAELPCAVCYLALGERNYGVHVHHVWSERGIGSEKMDGLTVPLCVEHHVGVTGIHGLGAKGFERRYKLTEWHLLDWTNLELER